VNERGLILDSRHLARLTQQIVVEIQRRPHMPPV
jgi:hypothetical protein